MPPSARQVRTAVRSAPQLPTECSPARRVSRAVQALARAHDELDAAVLAMRDGGASWREVGAALGIAAQSAHKRFRHLRSPLTKAVDTTRLSA